MAKKTVFTGVINGEKFDNVADYNARMNELLSQGVENISAASSTEIRNVDENVATSGYVSTCTEDQCPGTCTSATTELPEDEDLSFYPFMEDDDPYYLDLLATSDPEVNVEALAEAKRILEKCWINTKEVLDDKETTNDDRKDYLEDIREIINNLKLDASYTEEARDKLRAKVQKAENELKEAQKKYNELMDEVDVSMKILDDADKVTSLLKDYYLGVENEVITSIQNHKTMCKCGDPNCPGCDAGKVVTTCKETKPQTVRDFRSILDRIFGTRDLF